MKSRDKHFRKKVGKSKKRDQYSNNNSINMNDEDLST